VIPSPSSAHPQLRVTFPLFFAVLLSGASALAYETVWTRSFAIVLGSTVEAASATFAAFLVGLAAGAWLLGRRAPPARLTVHAYMAVELCIAATAPLCGLILHRYADEVALLIGAGHGPRALWAFGTVLAVVLIPTIAMGGSFPLMLTVARRLGAPVTVVGRLYGINILGSAIGTVACGFFWIRLYGVESALWIGAVGNIAAALACLPLLRAITQEPTVSSPQASGTTAGKGPSEAWLLSIAATSGALVLGLEVIWTRLASYFLGNRTYAFTTLLACVLVLLAIGSWMASRLLERSKRRSHELFGWVLVSAAGCVTFSTIAAWWWIRNQLKIEPLLPGQEHFLIFYRTLETCVLLAPPLIALGCLFPLSLMCSSQAQQATGRTAGRFYAANTGGAVLGSLGVGFWGSSALGVFGSTAALIWIGALLALGLFGVALSAERRRSTLAGALSVVALLVAAPILLPATLTIVEKGEELAFRREDERGVLQVLKLSGGLTRATNNRTELVFPLGLVATSFVQEMQGHLAVFHQPDAKRAAVLGSGYGVTAGALAQYPGIEHIDAVEILPGLVEAAGLFEPFNHAYHRDPRVSVVVDDGRHFLLRSEGNYDVISINVSDPHLPGGANLFHSEFYEIVKERLAPGGVVVQHAFGPSVDLILRTLLDSFKDVRLFPAYANGYNVIASQQSLDRDFSRADILYSIPSVQHALSNIGVLPPVTPSIILSGAIEREEVALRLLAGPLATDDHPLLEFAWGGGAANLLYSNE
jgi:spermidine synthase